MNHPFRQFTWVIGSAVLLLFLLFVVNQTAEVVQLAQAAQPTLGTVVFWALIATYGALLIVPVVLFFRLSPALDRAAEAEGPAFEGHLEALSVRLAENPRLQGHAFEGRDDIEGTVAQLDEDAEQLIRQSAFAVFMSTAISQSGRLDGLMIDSWSAGAHGLGGRPHLLSAPDASLHDLALQPGCHDRLHCR